MRKVTELFGKLIYISYLSFLLLIMSPNLKGIVFVLISFVVGSVLIHKNLQHKRYQIPFLKSTLAVSIICLSCFGVEFYERWKLSSKIHLIADVISINFEILLFFITVSLSLGSVFIMLHIFKNVVRILQDQTEKQKLLKDILLSSIAASITVALSQIIIEVNILEMGIIKFFFAVLIVTIVILFFNCLIGNIHLSLVLGTGIFMMISVVNAYVYRFRGRLFEPADVFSIKTVKNVVANYNILPLPSGVIIGGRFT